MNRYFVSTFVKVGTFALVNGQKQGGNVASYFCLPDGRVVHAIAGPVDANMFLNEAKWAIHVHKLAALEGLDGPARFKDAVFKAHAHRAREYGISQGLLKEVHRQAAEVAAVEGAGNFLAPNDPITAQKLRALDGSMMMTNPGRIHLLLALFPLVKVQDVYKYVFEKILNEKVSSLPVLEK